MRHTCPRCGAENFANATQCGECQLPLLKSDQPDLAGVEERVRRARELVAAERYDQAIVQLVPASAAAPDNAEAQRLLGRAYQAKGSSQHAIRAFEAAMRAAPDDALTHAELGIAYRDAGRAEEAVAQLNIALQMDPDLAQAKEAYAQLSAERDQALEHAQEMAKSKPRAAAPDLAPIFIARRAHLLEARNGIALLIGLGLAFLGAYGLGVMFRLVTSPELVNPLPAFQDFVPRWVPVLAGVLGLVAATRYTHKVPLVGLISGAFAGWAAVTVAAAMAEIEVAAAWLYTWALASAGIAAGVESFAKFTHLNDRRKFVAVVCVLGLSGSVAWSILHQGRIYGYVRYHVSPEDTRYRHGQPMAGLDIALIAVDDPAEIYRTKTQAADEAAQDDEWLGSYSFERVPLQQYVLRVRNPFSGRVEKHTVEPEFAITQGTQYDMYIYTQPGGRGRPARRRGRQD